MSPGLRDSSALPKISNPRIQLLGVGGIPETLS